MNLRIAMYLLFVVSAPLAAQSSSPVLTSSTGTYSGTDILGILDSQMKSYSYLVSPSGGYLKTGLAGEAKINFNSVGGAAYGIWGFASGTGAKGPSGSLNDLVGVIGTAKKDGPYWAAGLHADCLDSAPGGTCIGVDITFPQVRNQSTLIGVNIQPVAHAQNIVGMQFQNPSTYKYSIDAANTYIKVGQNGSTPFCMKFDPSTQYLEFWRGCQNSGASRVGYVNMNAGISGGQMN